MKTREGFVSNSSSSSFCIYGVHADRVERNFTPEMLGKVRAKILSGRWSWDECFGDLMDDGALEDWIREDDEDYILEEIGEDDDASNGTLEHYDIDGYHYYGLGPQSIKDDETGAQFKARVKKLLEDAGIKGDPSWVEEAYYC